MKKSYEAPVLRKHGQVEKATKGNSTGSATDAVIPVGTPFGDITFS